MSLEIQAPFPVLGNHLSLFLIGAHSEISRCLRALTGAEKNTGLENQRAE